jgi:hypothetical protein
LPSARQLLRSTIFAVVSAAVILVTVVLPAEYAIDPTGIGRMLGLTDMGEIKQQLEEEAKEDHSSSVAPALQGSSVLARVFDYLIPSASAQTPRKDTMSVTLKPGEGAEVKLQMNKDASAAYSWTATDKINYDLHVDKPDGAAISYKQGRGVASDEGSFVAAIDGYHGWFWRNRTKADVTVTVNAEGAYAEMKRMK